MNAFANWMFSALLGWTGGVANRIWNSVSGGKSWFASLLSTIWLPLLLIIIAVCTLIDAGYALKQRSILRKNNLLSHMLAKKRTDMFSKEPVDISDNYAAAPETIAPPPPVYDIFEDDTHYQQPEYYSGTVSAQYDSFNAQDDMQYNAFHQNNDAQQYNPDIYMPPAEYNPPVYEEYPADNYNGDYAPPVQEQYVYEQPVYEQYTYEQPIYEQPVYEQPMYEQPMYEQTANVRPPRRRRAERNKDKFNIFETIKEKINRNEEEYEDYEYSEFNQTVIPQNYRYEDTQDIYYHPDDSDEY